MEIINHPTIVWLNPSYCVEYSRYPLMETEDTNMKRTYLKVNRTFSSDKTLMNLYLTAEQGQLIVDILKRKQLRYL